MTEDAGSSLPVAITGLGAVSGFGWGASSLWQGLSSGKTAITEFDVFDASPHRTNLASQVPAGAPSFDLKPAENSRLSRADQFGLAASLEALRHADLDLSSGRARTGVFFGSSTSGMFESEGYFRNLLRGDRNPRVSLLASHQNNGPGDAVARYLDISGPVETISVACAGSTLAMGAALDSLRSGEVDVAIVGGADGLCELTYAGFNSLRAVDPKPSRPFRRDREGMSLGEGAAVLLLETLSHARRRDARPHGFLVGAGASCDAFSMAAPHPDGVGAARAVKAALLDAGMAPEMVDFVNVHGTGTPHNDAAEWLALQSVFGEGAGTLPLTSCKGAVGHLLGSAGVLEAVATVLCLEAGEVHPTAGVGDLDPALGADLVVGRPRTLLNANVAVSLNLAFGGANAAVVLSLHREEWS